MRPNKLRELLRAGKPSVGTHLHSIWPSLVEIVGHTGGYDYIEFSGEYAPYDMYGLEHWCRAAELMDLGTLIKLDQEPRTWLAQRAIGAGFQASCSRTSTHRRRRPKASAWSGRTRRAAAGSTAPRTVATATGATAARRRSSMPSRTSSSW